MATMQNMTFALAGQAEVYGYVVDIGQLDAKKTRKLNALAKKGEVVKVKGAWPWLMHGTCLKTFYIGTSEHNLDR